MYSEPFIRLPVSVHVERRICVNLYTHTSRPPRHTHIRTGRVEIAPKKEHLKEALKDAKEFSNLINKKNELTAAAHASTDGGRLNVSRALRYMHA